MDGHWVRMVDATQADYLLCKFDCGDSFVGTFKIEPKTESCGVTINTELLDGISQKTRDKIHMNQFQVLVNNATTGHKLQGRSLDSIFVSDWCHVKNWAYVVISRVKTLKGLFLREPLDPIADYSLDNQLLRMIQEFS